MSKLFSKLAKARKIHFFVNQDVLKLIDAFFSENMIFFLPFFSNLGINIA